MEFKFKRVTNDDKIGHIVCNEFTTEYRKSFILIGEEETCVPEYYEKYAESIENFEVRDTDVIVASFPKTGSTWMQEMVWLIANDLDYEGARELLHKRFPLLEMSTLLDCKRYEEASGVKNKPWVDDSVGFLEQLQGPRYIKTHLPFSLLPQQIRNGIKSPKIIYVMRNPKDVCVSYYHYGKLVEGWRANLEDYIEVFLADKIMFGPFWKNVLGYWNKEKNLPNILIIEYEDMKEDLSAVINKIAGFLGEAINENQMESLCNHLNFDSMKNNDAVNFEYLIKAKREANLINEEQRFIRSGTVGKHKEELSAEMIEKIDLWIKNNIVNTDFEKEYNFKV